MRANYILYVLVLICTWSLAQVPQENVLKSGKFIVVYTNDGGKHAGQVIKADSSTVLIKTISFGDVLIPKYNIASAEIQDATNYRDGLVLTENKFGSHYSVNSGAIPLKKNQFLLRSHYFLVYSLNYGVNDRFSLGLNTGLFGSPILISGKYTFLNKDRHFACLEIGGFTPTYLQQGSYSVLSSLKYSIGNTQNNATIGVTYMNSFSKELIKANNKTYWQESTAFGVNFGFHYRLNNAVGFIADGFCFLDPLTYNQVFKQIDKTKIIFSSIGFRTLRKKYASWSWGLYYFVLAPSNWLDSYSVGIPFMGYNIRF